MNTTVFPAVTDRLWDTFSLLWNG